MKYLLDTNICAFFLRGKFDIDQEIDKVGWKNCYISEITVLELKYGVELSKQKDGINREPQLERFLSTINIVPITGVLSLAAQEKIRLRLAGTPADDDFDLLIVQAFQRDYAYQLGETSIIENTSGGLPESPPLFL